MAITITTPKGRYASIVHLLDLHNLYKIVCASFLGPELKFQPTVWSAYPQKKKTVWCACTTSFCAVCFYASLNSIFLDIHWYTQVTTNKQQASL